MSELRVAVVGLGAIGSHVAAALAGRGYSVVGYEQQGIGHDDGASGGQSRMFRVLYGEGALYVPLLLEARELWLRAAADSGDLLLTGGALTIGSEDNRWVRDVAASGLDNGLQHDVLDADALRRRFPAFRVADDEIGIVDPLGGIVLTHQSVIRAAGRAVEHGADLRTRTLVTAVRSFADRVDVTTAEGTESFDHAVVTTGPWAEALLPSLPIARDRVAQTIHAVTGGDFSVPAFPPAMHLVGDTVDWATQPMPGGREIKLFTGQDHWRDTAESGVGQGYRPVPADVARRREELVPRILDGVHPTVIRGGTYVDGYTPDGHPFIGRPSPADRVVAAAGFSGHGFKLAPALGRLIADIVDGTPIPPGLAAAFALDRPLATKDISA